MIVLDTNVLSELIKPSAAQAVVEWMKSRNRPDLFTTAVTEAELLQGVELLPDGKRRDWLRTEIVRMLRDNFANRILSFDSRAARAFAIITSTRKSVGRPVGLFDAQIAAIARTHGAAVATGDVRDFEHCGVELVDPWNQQP
jgi:predicted nucleic acid-binding protein